jgi:basic membrane protein A
VRGRVLVGLVVVNAVLLGLGAARRRPDATAEKRLRVGLVLDVGGLGDKSFNDAAWRGLERAQADLDVETRFIEPGDGSDRESAIRQLAASGYDLVVGVGFIFTDDLRAAAARFPAVRFAGVDFSVVPGAPPLPPNLVALRFREEEGSFLVGALAALVSRTKVVGFVGGMDIPLIRKFEAGYRAGVAATCAACTVLAAYAGTDPRAFADPTTGKELALAQMDRGADVVYHAAGKTGAGVLGAAEARGKLAIGVDSDQFHEAPCCVLTSMVKGVDVAVYDTIRATAEGRFRPGVRELGLAEGGVGYVYDDRNKKWITDAVHAQVEALRARIVSGEIRVPSK